MSFNFDHEMEWNSGLDNKFISSDQDFYSAQSLGQCGALDSVVDSRSINFEDFILFPDESDEDESFLDTNSVLQITGETRMDQIYHDAEAIYMDAHTEQSPLLAADGLSNGRNLVDIFGASALAPWSSIQRADPLMTEHSPESSPTFDSSQELSQLLSSPESEGADDKRCVPRARSFNCPTCAHVFSSQPRLSAHTRQTHTPRRFSCECGKMFHMRKDLRRHEATHRGGPRDFVCTCDRTYLRRDHLLRHIANMNKKDDNGYHQAATALP